MKATLPIASILGFLLLCASQVFANDSDNAWSIADGEIVSIVKGSGDVKWDKVTSGLRQLKWTFVNLLDFDMNLSVINWDPKGANQSPKSILANNSLSQSMNSLNLGYLNQTIAFSSGNKDSSGVKDLFLLNVNGCSIRNKGSLSPEDKKSYFAGLVPENGNYGTYQTFSGLHSFAAAGLKATIKIDECELKDDYVYAYRVYVVLHKAYTIEPIVEAFDINNPIIQAKWKINCPANSELIGQVLLKRGKNDNVIVHEKYNLCKGFFDYKFDQLDESPQTLAIRYVYQYSAHKSATWIKDVKTFSRNTAETVMTITFDPVQNFYRLNDLIKVSLNSSFTNGKDGVAVFLNQSWIQNGMNTFELPANTIGTHLLNVTWNESRQFVSKSFVVLPALEVSNFRFVSDSEIAYDQESLTFAWDCHCEDLEVAKGQLKMTLPGGHVSIKEIDNLCVKQIKVQKLDLDQQGTCKIEIISKSVSRINVECRFNEQIKILGMAKFAHLLMGEKLKVSWNLDKSKEGRVVPGKWLLKSNSSSAEGEIENLNDLTKHLEISTKNMKPDNYTLELFVREYSKDAVTLTLLSPTLSRPFMRSPSFVLIGDTVTFTLSTDWNMERHGFLMVNGKQATDKFLMTSRTIKYSPVQGGEHQVQLLSIDPSDETNSLVIANMEFFVYDSIPVTMFKAPLTWPAGDTLEITWSVPSEMKQDKVRSATLLLKKDNDDSLEFKQLVTLNDEKYRLDVSGLTGSGFSLQLESDQMKAVSLTGIQIIAPVCRDLKLQGTRFVEWSPANIPLKWQFKDFSTGLNKGEVVITSNSTRNVIEIEDLKSGKTWLKLNKLVVGDYKLVMETKGEIVSRSTEMAFEIVPRAAVANVTCILASSMLDVKWHYLAYPEPGIIDLLHDAVLSIVDVASNEELLFQTVSLTRRAGALVNVTTLLPGNYKARLRHCEISTISDFKAFIKNHPIFYESNAFVVKPPLSLEAPPPEVIYVAEKPNYILWIGIGSGVFAALLVLLAVAIHRRRLRQRAKREIVPEKILEFALNPLYENA